MAFQRTKADTAVTAGKSVAGSLDAYVSNLTSTFKTQMAARNAVEETKFNTDVLAGNISLKDQLTYRQAQLKVISDDPTEKTRIQGEIDNLKQQITQQTYTDQWTAKLADFQGGLSSVDDVLNFLNTQKANTTDQTVLNQINQSIAQMQGQKFTQTQDLIKNATTYAENSKSVDVIKAQITKVQGYIATAKSAGNDDQVSMYQLQLQSLQSAANDAQITNDVLKLGAVSATGAYGAVDLLNAINKNIANASAASGPVNVNGTTYASAKDFWTNKQQSFLSDSGSNGFFSELSNDLQNSLATKSSKNALTVSDLQGINSQFNTIGARSDMAPFAAQLAMYKQNVLQKGADLLTDTITKTFQRTEDVNKAVASLSAVQALGVNVDKAYTDILTNNAQNKNQQVQNILQTAQATMKAHPGTSPADAVKQAVAAGAGTLISPLDAAGQSEGALATSAVKTAAAGKGVNDPRTTAGALPTAPNASTSGAPAGLPQTGIHIIGSTYNGQNAGVNTKGEQQVYIVKDGVVLKRPASNPTPEITGTAPTLNLGSPSNPVQANNPNPTATVPTPATKNTSSPTPTAPAAPAASKPTVPAAAPVPNIKVVGPNYGGHTAPTGNTFVLKDGVLLTRPLSNPTPELK